MNHIDQVRAEMQEQFKEKAVATGEVESSLSPSGRFGLTYTSFVAGKDAYEMTKVELYQHPSANKILEFLVNYDWPFYGWAKTNDVEYLISAEDIYGGQTIIDLTNAKIAGYFPGEDGFIWTDFYLSPDGKYLATLGCYWACPTVCKIFDFTDPMDLPLQELQEIELLDNDSTIVSWADNETLKLKGIKRERVPEFTETGSFSMKTLSEEPMEWEVKISKGSTRNTSTPT